MRFGIWCLEFNLVSFLYSLIYFHFLKFGTWCLEFGVFYFSYWCFTPPLGAGGPTVPLLK